MKIRAYFFFFLAISLAGCTKSAEAQDTDQRETLEQMKLKITLGTSAVFANLEDNATARDFISLLPISVVLEDYAGIEKIFYPDRKLSTEGAPNGFDPSVGDITYYAPWGDVAIFYRDFGFAGGLIPLGTIEANGVEILKNAGGAAVTFELEVQ